MAKIAIEHVFNGTTVPLVSLDAPSNVTITNIGSAGSTTYTYHVSAYNSAGETTYTTVVTTTGNATLSSTNFNRISWDKVWGATGYKVYDSSGNLILSTTNLHGDDEGADASADTLPTKNTTGYNSLYTSVGSLMYQSGGAIGPMPVAIARPQEETTNFEVAFPAVIPWSPTIDWIFLIEGNTSPGATRRMMLYEFNRSTDAFTWKGRVTLTFPATNNHTIRGFAMSYEIYTTGTVSVSGTAVTGSGTDWVTNRLVAGSRIGFGSTDPTQISTWYEISSIGGDTSITLTSSAGTISANSVYCIEDLRAVVATTNATATNGGLFVAKGLKYENFVSGGTTISAAVSTDNQRAVYWLADASTVTNTTACGNALDDKEDWNTQYVYVLDSTSGSVCYVYNIRASLTSLSSGKTTSGFAWKTGSQTFVAQAMAQQNNGEIVVANHGIGKGVKSLYLMAGGRVYRAEVSNLVNGNTTWVSDCMPEIPPGGTNTFTASSLIYIEHMDFIDDFVLYASGGNSTRSYITDYNAYIPAFESILGTNLNMKNSTLASANLAVCPTHELNQLVSWNEEGISYVLRQNANSTLNQIYAVPLSACYTHTWQNGREQYVITPAMPTPKGARLYRAYINSLLAHGGNDTFAVYPEVVKAWYRTDGIHDNTGTWMPLADDGDLTGTITGSDIQFRLAFKVCGIYQLPSKVYSVCAVYESEDDIPSHLQWNMGDTSSSTGVIGFIQNGTYGSVPDLQISYYRSDDDTLIFTQDSTVSTYGDFEYWNGSAWTTGLGTDTDNIRRRFNPTAGILTGINVYCKLKVV